jgi:hypothetical protein
VGTYLPSPVARPSASVAGIPSLMLHTVLSSAVGPQWSARRRGRGGAPRLRNGLAKSREPDARRRRRTQGHRWSKPDLHTLAMDRHCQINNTHWHIADRYDEEEEKVLRMPDALYRAKVMYKAGD